MKHGTLDTEITTNGNQIAVTVYYAFAPGEPDQWTDRNGDPGTPGVGAEVWIETVVDENGFDWFDGLSAADTEKIELLVIDKEQD